MQRYLFESLAKDVPRKIIILSGPRQCGKTTLSRMVNKDHSYLNFDSAEDRLVLQKKSWDRTKSLLILDELHKMKNWKSWLKGVYDTEGLHPPIIVSGSARLDAFRRVGDSLAGRYFQYRLHPLDLKEVKQYGRTDTLEKQLDLFLDLGGFPEPYLEEDVVFYNKWKKTHLDIILRQDMVDLQHIRQITQIETLVEMLKERVGYPLSYSSLAEDLNVSDKTVKEWLTILENMYVVFKVLPFHRNIARSMLKRPKYYFFDTGQVKGDPSLRLENTVACALLKEIHFQQDVRGNEFNLHYLQNKSQQEMDFFITRNKKPCMMIEVKWGDDAPSRHFQFFERYCRGCKKIQLVKELRRDKTFPDGVEVRRASTWLSEFGF